MRLIAISKRLAIVSGCYRPANWIWRTMHRTRRTAFQKEIDFFRSLLTPGCLCFDIGANIGMKSEALLAAGLKVVAFEPNPSLVEELNARCGSNKNWQLVVAGLGRCAAILPLHIPAAHWQSSFTPHWTGATTASCHVPVVTLDQAIEHFGIPDYCKIDVEGWETEVLQGLSRSIPLVSIEFHNTPEQIAKTHECLQRLAELGARSANLAAEGTPPLIFRKWMGLDEFISGFPHDIFQVWGGSGYGDIFVSTSSPDELQTRLM